MKFAWVQNLILDCFLCFFFVSEYLLSRKFHPDTTNLQSFLVTVPFLFAFSFGIAEYWIEYYIYGTNKSCPYQPMVWIGFFLIIIGLAIRITGICTAGKAFTHYIAYRKTDDHLLVTNGIYHFIRHPGYLGMFIFAIGSQLFLTNPISIIVFAAVLWKFFSDRIEIEEVCLVKMFGSDYIKYRSQTSTWIPFIK